MGATMSVSSEMRLTMGKKAFLANPSNKQALIDLLAGYRTNEGITFEHAEGEAEYKICTLACQYACIRPTAVVTEDSDVLQLLMYHVDADVKSRSSILMVT